MMRVFFEKNRNFLAKRFPFLLKEISGPVTEEITLEVERSKTGLPVARVNRAGRKVYLNSPYDPELDAQRWVANQTGETASGNILVCGGGFFYHVKALLNRETFEKVIVYEPSRAVFQACLQEIDLEPVCGPNVLVLVGDDFEDFNKRIGIFLGRDFFYRETEFRLAVLPSYKELFQEPIGSFQQDFMEAIRVARYNLATTDKFRENWLFNEFKNLRTISDTSAIRHFMGQFKNIPAIIVSAGPSLEKNIHLLNGIKENALIICAGSSIRAMKRNMVSPHFLLGIDPGEINTRVYNDLNLEDLYFLYNFTFNYGVVEKLRGKKVIFRTNVEIFPAFIEEKLKYEFGFINSGLSCAHNCLDLAYLLGCNPIIFIGQDLAYTSNKRYAEGQISSSQKYLGAGELPPGCFITKDIYGQDTVTDKSLDSFRIVFEAMIANLYHGKVQIINATEGGVPIAGMANRRLAEVLAEYCRENRQVSHLIQRLYEQGLKELRNRRIDPAQLVRKLKALIDGSIDKIAELVDRVQQLRKLNFYGEADFVVLDQILDKLAGEYDLILNYKEYHILLKDLQTTRLSINKHRTVQTTDIQSKEEYDERLRNYLLIIVETQKSLEYIQKCIEESFGTPKTDENKSQELTGDTEEFRQLEKRIRENHNLDEIHRLLERNLKHASTSGNRGRYLYLLGLLQTRANRKEQAIATLEAVIGLNIVFEKAYLLLAKLYYQKRNFTRAAKYVAKCREMGFQPGYCLKILFKINYIGKDYVACNNLLEEYQEKYTSRRLYGVLKAECLARLGLTDEAAKAHQKIAARLPRALNTWIENLIHSLPENEYAQRYRMNLGALKKSGCVFTDFSGVRYKICRFLGGELIYDTASRKFLPSSNQDTPCDLKLWLEDVLVIQDTDNINVFERLQQINSEIQSPGIQIQFQSIPIYVIDHDPEHWQMTMQRYDFNCFNTWGNMRYYIGITDEELQQIFLDESVPYPSILHGKNPEQFEELLRGVKQLKDEAYQKRLQELKEYYQSKTDTAPRKVLLIYNFKNDVSRFYTEIFKNYLEENGLECRMYHEEPPYVRFTPYATARVLGEYRPDLILGLGLVQEEVEAVNEIPVPFAGWLFADKSLGSVTQASCPGQRLFITGNLKVQNEMEAKGYSVSRILNISLPVVPMENKEINDRDINDIGIVSDLADLEETLSNLEVVIYGVLASSSRRISQMNITSILKTIYFKIHSEYLNQDLNNLKDGLYERVVAENFSKYGFLINPDIIQLIAALLKRELENSFFKTMHVRWIIDNFRDCRLAFYGDGWDKNEYFKPYHQTTANFFSDPARYQQLVLLNKINLYPGNMLRNNSYLQPDLLWGIAVGGFFLVNDLLVKEFGAEVLEPFGGLLESYGSRDELEQKVKYYLSHDQERWTKAGLLKKYMLNNFGIDSFMKVVIDSNKIGTKL
jgi:hypothetical protein